MPKPHKDKIADYRDRQRTRKKGRMEITSVPDPARAMIRDHAEAVKTACAVGAPILRLVVKTLNAPLPHAVEPEAVMAALLAWRRRPELAATMREFFRIAPMGTLHDLVIAKALTFEDLRHALHVWAPNPEDCPHAHWIEEMADLTLARDAA